MMLYKRFQRIIELTRHLEVLAGRHPEGFSPKDLLRQEILRSAQNDGWNAKPNVSTCVAPEGFSPKDLLRQEILRSE